MNGLYSSKRAWKVATPLWLVVAILGANPATGVDSGAQNDTRLVRPRFANLCPGTSETPGTLLFNGHRGAYAAPESGWVYNEANGHYYKITAPLSYWNAQAEAERCGGALVP
ncbi:MAG TPA: hypothetical protein PK967_16130 [Candidatus Hydrogenedentes bacterium]|nr:hypothetical protein [Candidatus Hydrogenedentota bacterium]